MKKVTFLVLGLIALVACEAELETEKEYSLSFDNNLTRNGSTISPEEAAAQALEFRNSILNQSGQTRGKKSTNHCLATTSKDEKGVASVYAWRSYEIAAKSTTRSTASDLLPDTLFYIVNFEDNCGYALVSANTLVPGVAAYIETGNLTPDQEIDNPGFLYFLDGYRKYVSDSIKSRRDSIVSNRDSLFMGQDSLGGYIEPTSGYNLIYFVEPLLQTRWGQTSPYNNECPVFDSISGGRCPAGCGAIAVAQVAAYHRYPTSYNGHIYNWDAILSDSIVSNTDTIASQSVAELIHDIGVLASINYDYNGSSVYFPFLKYCWEAFGYQYYRPNETPSFFAIKEDISNGRPVVIIGSDIWQDEDNNYQSYTHIWVVDGIAIKRHIRAKIWNIPDRRYVHCNWGWDGNCDGYFILGAFETRYDINTDYGVGGYGAFNKAMNAYYSVCPIN